MLSGWRPGRKRNRVTERVVRLGALLGQGTERLRLAGVIQPRREAFRIWADLGADPPGEAAPAEAVLALERAVPPLVSARFQEAVLRRAAGEPLAYVTGRAGFRHLTLRADRRALIPRPETEGLVDLVLERVNAGRVLDVGTGTGCLALSLALEGAFEGVVAVDRSPAALSLAAENARRVGATVSFVAGDLVAPLAAGCVDALVSNPPYLSADEYRSLDGSVQQWEPRLALFGGEDGLAATFRLLEEGRRVLRPGGWLALELDCTRAADCARRGEALGWNAVAVHRDLFGRERYLLARRSNTP